MYQTILIPLDRSGADRTILEHIRPLARLMKSRLVLMHVAEGHVARNQEQLNLADSEEMVQGRAYLESRRLELAGEGFPVEAHLGTGEPAQEILNYAETIKADLIAMATHGHRFLMDLVLGSVATDVRHRTVIPVLLIRARKS